MQPTSLEQELRSAHRSTPRKKINRRIKTANRFGWKCYWCSQGLRREMGYQNSATIEHLIPRSQGGPTSVWNLAAACYRCNSQRGSMCKEKFALLAREFSVDKRNSEHAHNAYVKERRRARHQAYLAERAARNAASAVLPVPEKQGFLSKIANIVNWLQTKIAPRVAIWGWAV